MLPAMTARVKQMLDSPEGKIRGPERLPADIKQQIDAAIPRQPIVKPKKARKLLVTDVQMYSGHSSIPHGNLMLELLGKYTGAFEPTFSNDWSYLKYPKIKEFDAVLLSLDVEKSDMATTGKFCAQCTRQDQDYALAWIKSYGKGRVYITPLGHTNIFYTSKPWVQHVLGAVQFVLGDLEADTTPSTKVKK